MGIVALVAAVCLALSALPAFGADVSSTSSSASSAATSQKTVRVGFYEDNDGFQAGFSDDARKSGYAYEYYQEIAKYAGWKYEYVYGSWGELYDKLLAGDIDIMAGVSKTDARQGKMLFPDNVMGAESYYIFVPTSYNGIQSGDSSSLNGKRIGVNDNSLMLTLFQSYVADKDVTCEIKTYDGSSSCAAALANGDIDGYIITDNYVVEGVKPVIKIGASDIYFALATGRQDLLADINIAQDEILAASPYYATYLQAKYFNHSILRQALTDTELAWLAQKQTLTIGYIDKQMPFSAQGADAESADGLVALLADETQAYLGVPVKTASYAGLEDLLAALQSGEVDAAFPFYGDIWTAERRGVYLTDQVASDQMVAIYTGTYDPSCLEACAVSDDTVGQEPYLQQYYPNAKIVHFATVEDSISALKTGKVGSIVMDSNLMQRYFSEHTQDGSLHVAYLDDPISFCVAVSENGSVLQSIMNKSITNIDTAKVNDAITRSTYAATSYSFASFFQHNVGPVVAFLICVIALQLLAFAMYRKKSLEHRRQLASANRAKSEFLSRMSHDIRTPMNAIVNLTNMAQEEMDDKPKLESDLKKITISSEFLLGLINDILDMSRIENDKLTLSPNAYRFSEFADYLDGVIRPLCEKKGIAFECSLSDLGCDIFVDRTRYNQVFFNLLSNAVKYTEPGGSVAFKMEHAQIENGIFQCDYVVTDTGCGMSEEFMTHLFQPFERANNTEAFTGTGLGLTITKSIIDAMGGTIALKSVSGQGTTVRVHLDSPVASPEQMAKQDKQADDDVKEVTAAAESALAGKRLLIAEDHPLNQEIARRLVMQFGLVPDCVENGQACVDRFCESTVGYYQGILMDIRMPVMDGLEATRAIRVLDRADARTVPIIAVSANAFADDEKASREAGMNAHISKPIDREALLRELINLLG